VEKTGHENLKTIVRRADYGRPKRLENVECEYFSYLGSLMSSDMPMKLNSEWPWRKQHSTKRKQFSPANWTQMGGRNY